MKCMVRPLLLSLLGLFLCGNASALQLLYPLDGTYVTKSNYLVIKGGTDPYLSGFTVEINGVESDIIDVTSEEYRAVFGDMLILEPLFDPGVNKIVVQGYLGGEKMSSVSTTVYYHNQQDKAPPTGFIPEVFHRPEREEPCAACHNMEPTAVELANPDPRTNPCGSCHMRMMNRKHVHGPAGVYECTYCHSLDSSPNKYQARPGDAELCVECHDDKLDAFRKAEFVHGPVDAGLCMVCHDPHASDEVSQLVMPAYDLCVACHEQVLAGSHVTRGAAGNPHPLKGVVNPAGSGEDLSCASCHDPHSGTSSNLFRWGLGSRFALCAKCHNK